MTNFLPDPPGVSDGLQKQTQTPQPTTLPPSPQPVGSFAKEHMEMGPIPHTENVPLVEISENEPVPEEVSSWMEKLEKGEDITLPQNVIHDDQVLVSPVLPQVDEETIVLPMTEEQVTKGLQQQLFTGARWLAEWCVRLMKKFHGKVMYRAAGTGERNHGTT